MFGTRALDLIFFFLLAAAMAGSTPLTVTIAARSFAPGEPLLLTIASTVPLESLEGIFLENSVFMTRTASPEGGDVWQGWTMIALDQQPGPATLDIQGRTADGKPVSTVYSLTIEPKDFPEERLTVGASYVNPEPEVQKRLQTERQQLAEIYLSRQPIKPSRSTFIRPVPGGQTSIFGTRRFFNDEPRSPHPGLDLRAATGTEVKASGSGQVVLAQDLHYSGNTVILDHGGGLFTLYAHLSEIIVEPGDPVDTGQLLGLSGATGRVTGPHLHWGAKIGSRPFDPTALLDKALWRK
jgi:murein DD-endopeptidase MepM/ murein hydrolase activator NlpD